MAGNRKGVRSHPGDRPESMDEGQVVRCIFGGQIQEEAESKGLRPWCDEHCVDGQRMGCFWKLKKLGILGK